jgi:3-isopropylmalate/(R)-2-methylmalate dehydratase small subunit
LEPVTTIAGPVSVLLRDDVDTDQIIPKQFLKRVERTGFGEFLFHDWAKEPGWALPHNPVLVTGRNFGCGSSREHAPWALEDYGFRAIIAPSFADIFRSNATKIGLLPGGAAEEDVRAIAEAGEAEVDLAAQEVRAGGRAYPLRDRRRRQAPALNGLDDIALTLQQADADRRLRARARAGRPVTAPAARRLTAPAAMQEHRDPCGSSRSATCSTAPASSRSRSPGPGWSSRSR